MDIIEEIGYKQILKHIGNENTKVCKDTDIRGNYYSCITDTIYLSKKKEEKYLQKGRLKELIIFCHEAIHSMQNKKVQMLNVVLSNVELIYFMILVLTSFQKKSMTSILIYLTILLLTMIIRTSLEIDAILKSFNLAKEVLVNFDKKGNKVDELERTKLKLKVMLPLEVIRLNFFRIIRGAVFLLI